MQIITFHDTQLHLQPDEQHEFLLTNKEVALGYGTNIQNLAHTKNNNSDELIENKHWIRKTVKTNGGKQKVIHWTKKGIVRLGFFIKSQQAKKFRDWAEDYIIYKKADISNPHQIAGYKGMITKQKNEIKKLKELNTSYYEQMSEAKMQLQKVKNSLGVDGAAFRNESRDRVVDLFLLFYKQANEFGDLAEQMKNRAKRSREFLNSLEKFLNINADKYKNSPGPLG